MQRIPAGNGISNVYAVTVSGDHHLKRYNFRVNGDEARDPYGVMVEPASNNSIVVDLALTEPDGGWVPRPPLKEREDSVIYEVHVLDFTVDESSGVDPEKRGKFLGMVQSGSHYQDQRTGIDHLKELGITHVQILPFYDFMVCAKNELPSCMRSMFTLQDMFFKPPSGLSQCMAWQAIRERSARCAWGLPRSTS